MKKLLVLVLAVAMTLALSYSALAAAAYVDYSFSGKITDWVGNEFDTKSTFLLGISAPIDNWFIGFDYISGKTDDTFDTEFNGYKLKGGYSFINNDTTRLTGTLGFETSTIKPIVGDVKLDNVILIGLDSEFKFGDNMSLAASFDYGVSSKTVDFYGTKVDLDSLLDYRVKFNYYFNENFGIGLGYYYYSWDAEAATDATTFSGFSLGASFRF